MKIMIQGNQLRIGNMVFDWAKRIATVESINSHDVVRLSSSDYKFESFNLKQHGVSPIPLTEDWLLNLGFEYKFFEEGETKSEYFFHKDLFPEYYVYYLPYFNMSIYIGDVTIQYVHQLQNLYFALTGEELKLKA